jgi:hypothetical protein
MKVQSYTADRIPHIYDTNLYCKQWIAWWTACQLPWRKTQGWPFPREQCDNTQWGKLTAHSQNSLFIVVMSTTWWAASLKPTDNRHLFDEAVDDIRWVIKQMLKSLTEPSTTNTTQNPPHPEDTQNLSPPNDLVPGNPTVTWMTRQKGKCQPKPSRALLEKMV